MTVSNPNDEPGRLRITGFDPQGITAHGDSNKVDVKFLLSRTPTSHEVADSDTSMETELNFDRVNLVAGLDEITIENIEINKLPDWVRAANGCLSSYESAGSRASQTEEATVDAARQTLNKIDFQNL